MTAPQPREYRRIGPHNGMLLVETPRPEGGTYYITGRIDVSGGPLSPQALDVMFGLLERELDGRINPRPEV